MHKFVAASLMMAGLFGGAAFADVSDFAGTWVNAEGKNSSFIGSILDSKADGSEVARIVATPIGVNAIRFHLYGGCDPECDWGAQLGHNRSGNPNSDDVESISADFDTGNSIKHLTLRKGPGHSLHFSLATDFKDHSGHHDFEVSGSLRLAPVAPVAAAAPNPLPSSLPAAPIEPVENCAKINPEDVFVAPGERGWKLRDYNHVILDYGSDKAAGLKASRVLEYYRIDEQCSVGGSKPKMIYWRVAGQIPHDSMPGEDCVDIRPQAITAKGGQVIDGDRVLVDFEDDAASAAQTVSVIRTYRINRQCFVARPSDKMVYWLSK